MPQKIVKTVPLKRDLKRMRRRRGLSEKACAEQIGLSHSEYRRIEAGKDPRLTVAVRVAWFFGVKVTDIWLLYPNKPDSKPYLGILR